MEKIISYEKEYKNDDYIVAYRNPHYWRGEVEYGFKHVVSSHKEIVNAYQSHGIPELAAPKPKPKRKQNKNKNI